MHILFVCTGNICRSPTAERLTAAYGSRHQVPGFHVSSAGTRAVIGHPIHPLAVPILEGLGGDASDFFARQLTLRIALAADLILTMTSAHRDTVLEMAPRRLHRTFTLSEAAQLVSIHGARTVVDLAALRPRLAPHDVVEIPDPIGEAPEVFAEIGAQIANLLSPIFEICQRG